MISRLDQALSVHQNALALRAHRAQILASNLANADTPGYQARDFDFKAEMQRALANERPQRLALALTDAGHIDGGNGGELGIDLKFRVPAHPSLDGNTVDTQLEQSAFSANAMKYMASLNFLRGKGKGLLTAIKGQ